MDRKKRSFSLGGGEGKNSSGKEEGSGVPMKVFYINIKRGRRKRTGRETTKGMGHKESGSATKKRGKVRVREEGAV